jgi:cbb3-type cytochrome oxidase maturation protein
MSVLYVLLPVALLFALIAVGVFAWSVRDGQLDDLESPAHRMLFDDPPGRPERDPPQPGERGAPRRRA